MEKCGMQPLRAEKRAHRGAEEVFCVRGLGRVAWESAAAAT